MYFKEIEILLYQYDFSLYIKNKEVIMQITKLIQDSFNSTNSFDFI